MTPAVRNVVVLRPRTGLPIRQIATRCRSLTLTTTGNKQILSRTAHVLSADVARIKVGVATFMLRDAVPGEVGVGAATSVIAAIGYNGTWVRVPWGGSTGAHSIADATLEFSDWVNIAAPKGATIMVETLRTSTAGILYNGWRNSAMGELTNVAVSGLTDVPLGGAITSSGNFTAPPFMLLGETAEKVLLIIGDSKVHGYNDTIESQTAAGPGLRGEIARGIPDTFPFVNVSNGGWRANLWTAEAHERLKTLPYFTDYYVGLGHNDLYGSGDTALTVKTNLELIYAAILAANPLARIRQTTASLSSTSTSAHWLNDQTVSTHNAEKAALNALIRTSSLTGQNNGYIEVADHYEPTRDAGTWITDGVTNNLYTVDGTHPQPAGYALGASTVPTP